jgi:hypothetical protein
MIRKNEKKTNHLHHRVAQEALRLRCVRSVCCEALHKKNACLLCIVWYVWLVDLCFGSLIRARYEATLAGKLWKYSCQCILFLASFVRIYFVLVEKLNIFTVISTNCCVTFKAMWANTRSKAHTDMEVYRIM